VDGNGAAPSDGLTERVKGLALAVGFDLAGVARAEPTSETRFLREWLARGYAGEMAYIGRRADERVDPRRLLPGARSVVAVGVVYGPGERPPLPAGALEVSRYAGGDDYHDVLIDRLRAVETGLEALAGRPVSTRAYVDTGPVQERVFAAYAGLGWIGKNTCLIHPRLGSYLFLGVLLTDLPMQPDIRMPDHCGTCRACLDACPTDAFASPYVLDATRCISYTTIESRGPIPGSLRDAHGALGFGCDVCQEVCPWNLRTGRRVPPDPLGLRARIASRRRNGASPRVARRCAAPASGACCATRWWRRATPAIPSWFRACARTPRGRTRFWPSTRAGRSSGWESDSDVQTP
jgi:epoxyqueuosine reductase